MPVLSFLKTNPIASASAAISTIIAILGALWALDSHYASAADLESTKATFTKELIQLRADQLDDKIFELQLKQNKQKGTLSPEDGAMLERYKRKLDEVHTEMKEAQEKAERK